MSQPPPPPPPIGYGPPPPLNPSDERTYSVLIHLSGILFGFIVPLIGYLMLRDRGPFIRFNSAQALNFQLSLLIYSVGLVIISLVTLGIGALLAIPVGIGALVLIILAAVRANQGQWYKYPLTIQFVQ